MRSRSALVELQLSVRLSAEGELSVRLQEWTHSSPRLEKAKSRPNGPARKRSAPARPSRPLLLQMWISPEATWIHREVAAGLHRTPNRTIGQSEHCSPCVPQCFRQVTLLMRAIAEGFQALNVDDMPCKTTSFYAQGVKVRSGESHFFSDGTWKRVVLTKPADGEIHVRALPDGGAVSLRDGLVLQVWQERLFGKKGRRVDFENEIGHFTFTRHESLYNDRLLQTSTDPALLRVAVTRGWNLRSSAAVGYMKRNAEATQRLYEEMVETLDTDDEVARRLMLLRGITDEGVLLAAIQRGAGLHVALPRLAEIATKDTVARAIDQAVDRWSAKIVSGCCRTLPVPTIAQALSLMLKRLADADTGSKQELEETVRAFVIGSEDLNVVNSAPSVIAATLLLMDQGVEFPYSVMKSRGHLRARLHPLFNQPLDVWKRVGAQTPNGAERVLKRRGRIACVLELPRDASELVELLDHEDIAVRRAALERLDDPERWSQALGGEWQGYLAERAPLEVLEALIRESFDDDLQGTCIRVARERGCSDVATKAATTCSPQGLHTATHSKSAAEIEAVLQAAFAAEVELGGSSSSRRIIGEVVARTRSYERLRSLSQDIADTDEVQDFPRINKRLRELELSEIAWQAARTAETAMARGAVKQMQAQDLLWEMNSEPALSRYAGERLVEIAATKEPF